MSKTVSAGIVTAYGAAVRGGYQGTYDQFCAALVQLTDVLNDLTGLSVTIETLEEGEQATAQYANGVLALGIPRGATGNGIQSVALVSTVGLTKTYRITYTNDDHFDFNVQDGKGIQSIVQNADYTLTVTYTDGTSWTSDSIRGAKGETGATPNLTVGTVTTLPAGQDATADIGGTPENPVLNFGIPKGSDYGMNVVTMTGTDITLEAQAETRYICGTLASLEITSLPTQGIVDIVFNSGSTATVLDLPSTVQMPEWFLLGANQTVEISILDGVYGSVMTWDSST